MLRYFSRGGVSPVLVAACLLIAAIGVPATAFAQRNELAAREGAFVEQDGKDRWVVGNDRISLSVGITSKGGLAIFGISRPGTEGTWNIAEAADVSVTAGERHLVPGEGDFRYRTASADDVDGSLRLSLVFESPSAKLRAVRTYACYPGSPAIETWTTFEQYQTSADVALSDVGIWELHVGGHAINWVTGLRTPIEEGGPFTLRRAPLGTAVQLGAEGRSTSSYVPIVWVDGPAGHLMAGLNWSGAWAISIEPPDEAGRSTIRASLGAIHTKTGTGSPLETPHGFYAVAAEGQVGKAFSAYIMAGIRRGRPYSPLVTFNTWYAYGIHINETSLAAQMDHAMGLGAERFVVDAGWYTGGTAPFDYSTGIGAWSPDPDRFPSGLWPLADLTHQSGLQFGIWMEPERIDLATLGTEGAVQESWLATVGGKYNPYVADPPPTDPPPTDPPPDGEPPEDEPPVDVGPSFAQICLGSLEARQWVVEQISRVIEQSGADYLKWDNNFWVNCDREGHGHGPGDGNLAHHQGLYEVLAQLRARFPNLVIENCAEGGNRLDPGMMRYTDTAWMDDNTTPSPHVRHNLQGLGTLYPPAYLLSFVKDDPNEPIHGGSDIPATFRSRMPGVLGMSLRGEDYGSGETEAMQFEITNYKDLRYILMDASLLMLTPQNGMWEGDGWDAIQLLSASTGDALVYAFANDGAASDTIVHLKDLVPEKRYRVIRAEGNVVGDATGEELMLDGIGVSRTPESASVMLLITSAPTEETPARTIRK